MRIRSTSLLCTAALWLSACSITGPTSVATGRSAYNAIINQTDDEQFLSMMVRQRYDETFGMLAVSSVTSSISSSAAVASDLGVGPRWWYEGSLVPQPWESHTRNAPPFPTSQSRARRSSSERSSRSG